MKLYFYKQLFSSSRSLLRCDAV